MTDADTIEAAADRIRDVGKQAGSQHDCNRESCAGFAEYRGPCGGCCSCLSGCVYAGPGDEDVVPGSWLDLVRPERVALHLEALLRASTGYWRLYENRGWSDEKVRANVGSAALAALDLANVILAETPAPVQTSRQRPGGSPQPDAADCPLTPFCDRKPGHPGICMTRCSKTVGCTERIGHRGRCTRGTFNEIGWRVGSETPAGEAK